MRPDRSEAPPAYAWDWFARQRLVWREVARRLAAPHAAPHGTAHGTGRGPHPDVPDWSDLLDRAPTSTTGTAVAARDWSSLSTRPAVVAALREDYPIDPHVRAVTDATLTELAFLDGLERPLPAHGVRAAPRGLHWWWTHLGGADAPPAQSAGSVTAAAPERDTIGQDPSTRAGRTEHPPTVPIQLRFIDVLAGYGDH